jgi:hypothetical protein
VSHLRMPLAGQGMFAEFEADLEAMREANPVPPREEWPWIPDLDPAMQADRVVAPVHTWGSRARGLPNHGTYHFYVDDYQFNALWENPEQVPASGCAVAAEVNYTTLMDTPKAGVLWTIYRKRIMAAYWQMCGVRILVDLNVHWEHRDLALVGVPRGWRAYADRCHARVPVEELEADWRMARDHAGTDDILFAVFGGGKRARSICRARRWVHVPDHIECVRGRMAAYAEECQ